MISKQTNFILQTFCGIAFYGYAFSLSFHAAIKPLPKFPEEARVNMTAKVLRIIPKPVS